MIKDWTVHALLEDGVEVLRFGALDALSGVTEMRRLCWAGATLGLRVEDLVENAVQDTDLFGVVPLALGAVDAPTLEVDVLGVGRTDAFLLLVTIDSSLWACFAYLFVEVPVFGLKTLDTFLLFCHERSGIWAVAPAVPVDKVIGALLA